MRKIKQDCRQYDFYLKKTIAERVKLRRQKADDKDPSDMLLLKGDEGEVKEGTELKILTSNKLLTRLSILLA